MNIRRSSIHRCSGQAIVEFIVGIVALLALLAGLFQLASLTRTHTDTMVEARRLAGEKAIEDLGPGMTPLFNPLYIRDWHEGPDTRRHTRDDTYTSGDLIRFDEIMVENAVADPGDWNVLDQVPNNRISLIHDNPNTPSYFGLVKGSDSRTVDLIPAARHLFYDANSVDVRCDVWMTWTKGIY